MLIKFNIETLKRFRILHHGVETNLNITCEIKGNCLFYSIINGEKVADILFTFIQLLPLETVKIFPEQILRNILLGDYGERVTVYAENPRLLLKLFKCDHDFKKSILDV